MPIVSDQYFLSHLRNRKPAYHDLAKEFLRFIVAVLLAVLQESVVAQRVQPAGRGDRLRFKVVADQDATVYIDDLVPIFLLFFGLHGLLSFVHI